MLRNKRGRDSERPAHRDEERPPLAAARESPRTETKTQHSNQSINLKKKKKKKSRWILLKPLPFKKKKKKKNSAAKVIFLIHWWGFMSEKGKQGAECTVPLKGRTGDRDGQ